MSVHKNENETHFQNFKLNAQSIDDIEGSLPQSLQTRLDTKEPGQQLPPNSITNKLFFVSSASVTSSEIINDTWNSMPRNAFSRGTAVDQVDRNEASQLTHTEVEEIKAKVAIHVQAIDNLTASFVDLMRLMIEVMAEGRKSKVNELEATLRSILVTIEQTKSALERERDSTLSKDILNCVAEGVSAVGEIVQGALSTGAAMKNFSAMKTNQTELKNTNLEKDTLSTELEIKNTEKNIDVVRKNLEKRGTLTDTDPKNGSSDSNAKDNYQAQRENIALELEKEKLTARKAELENHLAALKKEDSLRSTGANSQNNTSTSTSEKDLAEKIGTKNAEIGKIEAENKSLEFQRQRLELFQPMLSGINKLVKAGITIGAMIYNNSASTERILGQTLESQKAVLEHYFRLLVDAASQWGENVNKILMMLSELQSMWASNIKAISSRA